MRMTLIEWIYMFHDAQNFAIVQQQFDSVFFNRINQYTCTDREYEEYNQERAALYAKQNYTMRMIDTVCALALGICFILLLITLHV